MVALFCHWLWPPLLLVLTVQVSECGFNIFTYPINKMERKYGSLPESERLRLKEDTRDMFYFGYDNYMKYAYPEDELNPILCRGRGPDRDDPLLGALLSAHLLIEDKSQPFGNLEPEWYNGELLDMASDLASRFMPAFDSSKTGLPHPRINLRSGVPDGSRTDTCTAGAGSLLVEFGVLSRLIGDPVYELSARRAIRILWTLRNEDTGLLGNVVDVDTGKWVGELSGVGAGLDSFYEYLLKAYILFGNPEDYYMFNETYSLIKHYMRRGRPECNYGAGDHPLYVNVDMKNGGTYTTWIDSLQAAFAGMQATKNPFYLHVGRDILSSLNNLTRARCGYATVHSVLDMTLEDRMESFFLSETCKYLYLLFDADNPINLNSDRYMFTTEGHIIPLASWLRQHTWEDGLFQDDNSPSHTNLSFASCAAVNEERIHGLPLKSQYLEQISLSLGVEL